MSRTAVLLAGCCALWACGEPRSGPTAPDTPAKGADILTTLVITGPTTFTSVGETARFVVTATFGDGVSRDVSAESTLTSTNPEVASIAPGGLASITGFGVTRIAAKYRTASHELRIEVVPAGYGLIEGGVRQPGAGHLPGVLIRSLPGGLETRSGRDGSFSLIVPDPAARPTLVFEKEGYETAVVEGLKTARRLDVPMQAVVRLDAGGETSVRLAPHDLVYPMTGGPCSPCRLIRVSAPAAGRLAIQVTSAGDPVVGIWRNGQGAIGTAGTAAASLPVDAGETVVFVGFTREVSPSVAAPYQILYIRTAFETGG